MKKVLFALAAMIVMAATAEEFGILFGMATTMGKEGKPTEIDFTNQFVLAIVLPITNLATEINPIKLEEKGDTLFYFYDTKVGEAQTYSTRPISLIILDKKFADKQSHSHHVSGLRLASKGYLGSA